MRQVGSGLRQSKARVAPAPRTRTEDSYAPSFASNPAIFADNEFFTRENVEHEIDSLYSDFINNNKNANIRNSARRLELQYAVEDLNERFGAVFHPRNWSIVIIPRNAKMSTLLKELIDDSKLPEAPEASVASEEHPARTFAEDMREFERRHPSERTHVYQNLPGGLSARRILPHERTTRELPVASYETEGQGKVRRCRKCGGFK